MLCQIDLKPKIHLEFPVTEKKSTMTDSTGGPFNPKTVLPPIGKNPDAGGGGGGETAEGATPTSTGPKPKMRPPKLKTPMDLVISAELASCTSHHRPIGTPPPTSLRKPRQCIGSEFYGQPPGGAHHGATPDDPFDPSFPQINVENCLEQTYDDVGSSFESSSAGSSFESSAFPALNSGCYQHQHSVDLEPPPNLLQQRRPSAEDLNRAPPDNQRTRINSENNNQVQDFYNSLSSTSSSGTGSATSSMSGLTPPQRLMARDQDGVVFELTTQDRQAGGQVMGSEDASNPPPK